MPFNPKFVRSFCLWIAFFAILAFLYIDQAIADTGGGTGGVDISSNLSDIIGTLLTVLFATAIYIARAWSQQHLGVLLDDKDMQLFESALVDASHSWLNKHLLNGGTVTVNTKNEAALAIVGYLNANYPAEVKRIGLTPDALVLRAEGAAAKALNLMPAAPPYASAPAAPVPATPVPAAPAST